MGMPVLDLLVSFEALNFANQISLDVAYCVLTHDAIFGILVQVLPIEIRVESLRQQIKIDIVVLQQVKHVHLPDCRHFNVIFQCMIIN